MRTIDHLSSTEAVSWVRSGAERLRNSAATRHPLLRWALAAMLAIGLAAAGYLVSTSMTPLSPRYLASERSFSGDDLIKVLRALDEKRIEYRRDGNRRIAVSAEQYDQASAVLAKLDIGRHSVGEIRDESNSWSFLETPREKDRRELVRREKMLEAIFTQFPDVAWAVVSIRHPEPRHFLEPRGKPSAFVFVETDGDRPLPALTVQSIASAVVAKEPEIAADAITVMDRRGHPYLEAGKPGQGDLSRNRAREEELREEILEKLSSFKGVEVLVSLTGRRGEGVSAAKPTAPIVNSEPATAQPSKVFVPKMVVNAPLGPLPERNEIAKVATDHLERDHPTPGADQAPSVEPVSAAPEGGRVVVTVPRSFYYNATITTDHREPSREELALAVPKIEAQIRSKVSLVVQDPALWKVEIYTNPDDVDMGRRAMLASGPEQRRKALDWGLVGAGAAAVAMLVALASWVQVARSPSRRTETVRGTRRYHADSPTSPAPSERVRELVRRNPETAASVLQRWTAQGGGVS